VVRTDVETAEMVKYTDNTWHALKVDFANEIGNICKAVGIDGQLFPEVGQGGRNHGGNGGGWGRRTAGWRGVRRS